MNRRARASLVYSGSLIGRLSRLFRNFLRTFFRHDRRLFSEISRLLFKMLSDFYNEAAGKAIESAAVIVFQTAEDFVRFNPHFNGMVLEGGF